MAVRQGLRTWEVTQLLLRVKLTCEKVIHVSFFHPFLTGVTPLLGNLEYGSILQIGDSL